MNEFFTSAKPVWAKGESNVKNLSLAFRLELHGETNVKLTLAACNFYSLNLNGEFIAYGPARGAHGHYRADNYELALSGEKDLIEIIVAGYRCKSFYGVNESPFLMAEVKGQKLYYTAENGDFECFSTQRVIKTPRYSYQRTFTECYDYSLVREKKQLEECGDKTIRGRFVGYPDYAQVNAEIIEAGSFYTDEKAEVYRNRCLEKESIGLYDLSELTENPNVLLSRAFYEKKAANGKKSGSHFIKNEYVVYKFDRIYSGFIGLNFECSDNSEVYIIFDEADVTVNGTANVDYKRNDSLNFVSLKNACGDNKFLSFEPYVMRCVKILVIRGEITVKDVYVKTYENPCVKGFKFSTNDNELNEIVSAAKNTFCQNAVDVPTDCPGRERAGWLCDSYFTAFAEKLFTGDNLTERNFLENYADNEKDELLPDGMIGMCYPADFEDGTYIPNWAMWYIVELKSYLDRTGDRALIEKSRKKVYGLIRFFEKYENECGLLENMDGWVFIEWSAAAAPEFINGVSFPTNMMYSLALSAAGELFGDKKLIEKSEKLAGSIRDLSFNGEFFCDNAVRVNGKLQRTENVSETCQYYAFFSEVASQNTHEKLWTLLKTEFGPERNENKSYKNVVKSVVFIGNYLRLLFLKRAGEKQMILKEAKELFLPMARKTGTLWEHSGLTASLDHGFASVAANLIVYATDSGECFLD